MTNTMTNTMTTNTNGLIRLGRSPYEETISNGTIRLHDGAFTIWALCARKALSSWERKPWYETTPREEIYESVVRFQPKVLQPQR